MTAYSNEGFKGFDHLYDNDKEKRQNTQTIEMLSDRLGVPFGEVERIYRIVLYRFKRSARVKDYLPILVSRRVRYLFDSKKRKVKT